MGLHTLTQTDLEDLLNGAVIYGSGGGGPRKSGQQMLDAILKMTHPAVLADPDANLQDDQTTGVIFFHSTVNEAPDVSVDISYAVKSFQALDKAQQAAGGQPFSYVLPVEIGAETFIPLSVGASLNLPVLDGDSCGRAINDLMMSSYTAHGLPFSPITLANNTQAVQLDVKDVATGQGAMWASIGGPPFNGNVGMGFFPVNGKMLKPALVKHSVSAALQLGRVLRRARNSAKPNPVQAVIDHTHGYLLFEGVISSSNRPTSDLAVGNLVVRSHDGRQTARIYNYRENLILWTSSQPEPAAMGPDLICYLTPEGKPFSNEDLDYMPNQGNGQAVAVIGIPANNAYRRNPAIWQAYHQSLQAMCYPGPYVPIEHRNSHGQ